MLPMTSVFDVLAVAATICGVAVIAFALVRAALRFVVDAASQRGVPFAAAQFGLARGLTLSLEFLLAAGILRTAAAFSLGDAAELAAIAAIRTVMNWTLRRNTGQTARERIADGREGRAWR